MATNFSKNAILTGSVDGYCLVCETNLKSDEEMTLHITKPVHQKTLEATQYVDQFKNDMIRKVKIGYFCELCNVLLNTLAMAKLHLGDSRHNTNKARTFLNRIGNSVVFGNIAISETAWNGLNDNACTICDVEYDDVNLHKSQKSHVLNLIRSKVMFNGDNIYRKLDDAFQCLTCNIILTFDKINSHFNDAEHNKLHQACRELKEKLCEIDKTKNAKANVALMETSNNSITETKTQNEKSAQNVNSKENNKENVNKDTIKTNKEEKSGKSKQKEFENFANENNLILKKDKKSAFCIKCSTSVTTLEAMKQHINSKLHIKRVEKIKNIKKAKIQDYLSEIAYIQEYDDVVMNKKICVNIYSLSLITQIENGFRCHCCEINTDQVIEHLTSNTHKFLKNNVYTVTEYDSEFIRELRSGFHCGFCNTVQSSWDNMKLHITSEEHKENKAAAEQRLVLHEPVLAEKRMNAAMNLMMNIFCA